MPKQTIVQLLDDLDGKPLDESTEPVQLTYDGITYNLYLSDVNEKKLADFIGKYTEGAEEVRTPVARAAGGLGAKSDAQEKVEAAGHTFHEVKEWALAKGTFKTAKGDPISPTAPRLSVDVWEAFAKHQDL